MDQRVRDTVGEWLRTLSMSPFTIKIFQILWINEGTPSGPFVLFFLAALCLHCCARAFSSCGKWGLLFVAVRGLLIAVASLVAEHRLQGRGLQ